MNDVERFVCQRMQVAFIELLRRRNEECWAMHCWLLCYRDGKLTPEQNSERASVAVCAGWRPYQDSVTK